MDHSSGQIRFWSHAFRILSPFFFLYCCFVLSVVFVLSSTFEEKLHFLRGALVYYLSLTFIDQLFVPFLFF